MRNKREESQHKQNMRERLDIAIAEQRLQNMRRDQAIEDELYQLRREKLLRESSRKSEEESILDKDDDEDTIENLWESPKPIQPLLLKRKLPRLLQHRSTKS